MARQFTKADFSNENLPSVNPHDSDTSLWNKVTNLDAVGVLNSLYAQTLGGVPGTDSAYELAEEYMRESGSLNSKVDSLIRWQNTKCAASGFVTGLGGLITLPAAIAADLGVNVYVQLRMVAAIALMGNHDLKSDKVRTFAYLALCGGAAGDILSQTGVKVANKIAFNFVQKQISKAVIKKINAAVGAKIITKAGTKGVINLTKAVPIVGGGVAALINGVTTNTIGNTTKKIFIRE